MRAAEAPKGRSDTGTRPRAQIPQHRQPPFRRPFPCATFPASPALSTGRAGLGSPAAAAAGPLSPPPRGAAWPGPACCGGGTGTSAGRLHGFHPQAAAGAGAVLQGEVSGTVPPAPAAPLGPGHSQRPAELRAEGPPERPRRSREQSPGAVLPSLLLLL